MKRKWLGLVSLIGITTIASPRTVRAPAMPCRSNVVAITDNQLAARVLNEAESYVPTKPELFPTTVSTDSLFIIIRAADRQRERVDSIHAIYAAGTEQPFFSTQYDFKIMRPTIIVSAESLYSARTRVLPADSGLSRWRTAIQISRGFPAAVADISTNTIYVNSIGRSHSTVKAVHEQMHLELSRVLRSLRIDCLAASTQAHCQAASEGFAEYFANYFSLREQHNNRSAERLNSELTGSFLATAHRRFNTRMTPSETRLTFDYQVSPAIFGLRLSHLNLDEAIKEHFSLPACLSTGQPHQTYK